MSKCEKCNGTGWVGDPYETDRDYACSDCNPDEKNRVRKGRGTVAHRHGTTCCVCAGEGEMPEVDIVHTDEYDYSIILGYEYFPDDDGGNPIERAYSELQRYAQAKAAEAEKAIRERAAAIKEISRYAIQAERLREVLATLRPKVLYHDPEYDGQRTNGPMPKWNGMLKMIDNALAGKE